MLFRLLLRIDSTPKHSKPNMVRICSLAVVFVTALAVSGADAAGLIRTLPADGTGAVFTVDRVGTETMSGEDRAVTSKGTLQVAIVGTKEVAGLKCRWIEVEIRENVSVGDEREACFKWWKLLIPERDLVGSQKGVSMALRTYSTFDPDAAEPQLIMGREDRRATLRAMETYFPPPPTGVNRINAIVKSKIAKTPAGDFVCDCHVFDAYTEKYLVGPSRMQESVIYRVWTGEQSPLGVAAMDIQSTAQIVSARDSGFADDDYRLTVGRMTLVTHLKLERVQHNVVSRFPEQD